MLLDAQDSILMLATVRKEWRWQCHVMITQGLPSALANLSKALTFFCRFSPSPSLLTSTLNSLCILSTHNTRHYLVAFLHSTRPQNCRSQNTLLERPLSVL